MACYHPMLAYRLATGEVVHTLKKGMNPVNSFRHGCGQCIGCRLDRSADWAIRCMHESKMHQDSCFITLTYDPAKLPPHGSLHKPDFQKFLKRLRKNHDAKFKYYYCGEYGEEFGRPHYHACIFGFDFADKYKWTVRNGFPVYRSPSLEKLWKFGFSEIGTVTFESAAYVARYITKKVLGKSAFEHYNKIDYETGEVLRELQPEYTDMSRNPGIGRTFLEKFMGDIYPDDFVLREYSDGSKAKLPPPKYYDGRFEILYPGDFALLKEKRVERALKFVSNNTTRRLADREEIQLRKLKMLPRRFESDI